MIGDKLVITEFHRKNGAKIASAILDRLASSDRRFVITVAGESGSGKSETAATTALEIENHGYKVVILPQDDYFRLPPRSNSKKRREDVLWVGTGEVRLDLLDEHLAAAKEGADRIMKPLVFFEEDKIGEEEVSLEEVKVIIAEGTYTTSLKNADFRAFIGATYHSTLEHRKQRARDETEGKFIEQVLEIEHRIIATHKEKADLILTPDL